jgi:hypothetical protein
VQAVRSTCIDCHDEDESYGEVLDEWRDDANRLLEEVGELIGEAERRLEEVEYDEDERYGRARGLFEGAKGDYELVRTAKAPHNFPCAEELLEAAKADLNRCLELLWNH